MGNPAPLRQVASCRLSPFILFSPWVEMSSCWKDLGSTLGAGTRAAGRGPGKSCYPSLQPLGERRAVGARRTFHIAFSIIREMARAQGRLLPRNSGFTCSPSFLWPLSLGNERKGSQIHHL